MSHRTKNCMFTVYYIEQEGLAVASVARDDVVEITPPPVTTMRDKFVSEFET